VVNGSFPSDSTSTRLADEFRISCAVHLAHAARTNSSENFIGADAITRGQRHLGLDYTSRTIILSQYLSQIPS